MKKWYLLSAVLTIMLAAFSCGPSASPQETTGPTPRVTEETQEHAKTEVSEQEKQSERIILQGFLTELQKHHDKLNKKYAEEKDTFDELDWGKWSHNWNRELNDTRNRLDAVEVKVPDYQSAKRFLVTAGGDLYVLWSEYTHNLTEGKEVDPFFKQALEEELKEADELLK